MTSTQFLSSYCIFSAAVSAFHGSQQPAGADLDSQAVANAFKKATTGMSRPELTRLTEYLQWLIEQPGFVARDRSRAYFAEFSLDHTLARRGGNLIEEGSLITAAELMERTGTGEERLAELVSERRVFKMPDWTASVYGEDYYPCFFAESKYDWTSLTTVSKALLGADGARKFRFFTTPSPDLDNQTPLEVLEIKGQRGNASEFEQKLERVLLAVKQFRKRAPQTKPWP